MLCGITKFILGFTKQYAMYLTMMYVYIGVTSYNQLDKTITITSMHHYNYIDKILFVCLFVSFFVSFCFCFVLFFYACAYVFVYVRNSPLTN